MTPRERAEAIRHLTTGTVEVAITAAVAEERERCARMAEGYDLGTPEGHAIAAAIRKVLGG
jgi:hypothetical protein